MRLFVSLISALVVGACGSEAPTVRSFARDTGRIISAEDNQIGVCMHQPSHDSRWTPTEADIAILDPVLIELIEYRLMEENLAYQDTSQMRPELYHRYYAGLERDGWRYILICGRYDATPVRFFDGGPSQFATVYDTRRQTFEWFQFGGRA